MQNSYIRWNHKLNLKLKFTQLIRDPWTARTWNRAFDPRFSKFWWTRSDLRFQNFTKPGLKRSFDFKLAGQKTPIWKVLAQKTVHYRHRPSTLAQITVQFGTRPPLSPFWTWLGWKNCFWNLKASPSSSKILQKI